MMNTITQDRRMVHPGLGIFSLMKIHGRPLRYHKVSVLVWWLLVSGGSWWLLVGISIGHLPASWLVVSSRSCTGDQQEPILTGYGSDGEVRPKSNCPISGYATGNLQKSYTSQGLGTYSVSFEHNRC